MVIFLLALALIGQAAGWSYTVTVKTATIESPGSDLNLTVTMEGKGGNRITHVLQREAGSRARRDATGTGWCEYADSYLYTYSSGTSSYTDLSSAQTACLERDDCGGITQEPYNSDRYTLRVGPDLYEGLSPTDEISWVVCDEVSPTPASSAYPDYYPSWPQDFVWSYAGEVDGYDCVQWLESADSDWDDNYLCWNSSRTDPGFQWSSAGAIAGEKCTQIAESADPDTWDDNYLCVPESSSYEFTWNSAGTVDGMDCIQIEEPAEPASQTWTDNWLCHEAFEGPVGCEGNQCVNDGSHFNGNVILPIGEMITSNNGKITLIMQSDSNLVLYRCGSTSDHAVWATATDGDDVTDGLYVQEDGNLVLYNTDGSAIWASGTDGHYGVTLIAQDDSNLVLYDSDGTALWASDTMDTSDCPSSEDEGEEDSGNETQPGSCLSHYYASSERAQNISSPNYPNEYDNNNDDCVSVISAESGQQIRLNFSDFQLETHSNCAYDYLEIRDGEFDNSTLIGKYCGDTSPGTIESTGNSLYINFHSDGSVTETGYYATITAFGEETTVGRLTLTGTDEEEEEEEVFGEDGFTSGSTYVFNVENDIYLGTLIYANITTGTDNAWQLDWMMVETEGLEGLTRYVYNTETQWLSTDPSDNNGTAVEKMELTVQGTEIYYLIMETAEKNNASSDNLNLKVTIHGKTGDTTTGYLDNEGEDDFVVGENDVFIVPGMEPVGKVTCITLECSGDDSWEFDWIVVFSVKSYSLPPRVFWNNETVLSSNGNEGVTEYYVCKDDNVWGSDLI